MITLALPFFQRACYLQGSPHDLSVMGCLKASGGVWEPHLASVMRRYIREDAICLDIGANIGVFTLIMSALAGRGHVYAIEPSSLNVGYLRENLITNNATNVTLFQRALWDKECQADLFHVEELAGCSFIEIEGDGRSAFDRIKSVVTQPWMNESTLHCRHERINCQRLDDFASEVGLDRLNWIKLDAEGAEAAVLTGGLNTISHHRPGLITEFNPACMIQYFRQQPSEYFELLMRLYPVISLIEETGELTQISDYPFLAERLDKGKGWVDLLCSPGDPFRS